MVTIEYDRACTPPIFDLCWDGTIMESYPEQIPLTVLRERGPDDCGLSGAVTEYFDLDYLNRTLAGNTNLQVGGALLDFPPFVTR